MTLPYGIDLLDSIREWPGNVPTAQAVELIQQLGSVENPTLFAECLTELTDRRDIVTEHHKALSTLCLKIVAARTTDDPPLVQLRAADALQVATQLALAGTNRLRVAAELADITGPQSPEFALAALRCAAALFEQYREPELLDTVRSLGGIIASHNPTEQERRWIDRITEDAAHELGAMTLLTAFDADDWSDVLARLDTAASLFNRAVGPEIRGDEGTERPDSAAMATLTALMRVLMTCIEDSSKRPEISELEHLADRLTTASRHHQVGYHGLKHWRDARVTAHIAWALLAQDIAKVHKSLEEDSWWNPAESVALIIDTYRATRVSTVWSIDADGDAIRRILAPSIESGIATRAGLTAHLRQRIHALSTGDVNRISDSLRETQTTQLEEARRLLLQVEQREKSSFPKDGGSLASGSRPADTLPTRANQDAEVPRPTALAFSSTMLHSLAIDGVYSKLRVSLISFASRYGPGVMEAIDGILYVVIDYVVWALDSTPSRAPYLFTPNLSEDDFSNAFQMFLATSNLARIVESEVRNRAGGRCDFVFFYPGFKPVIELKVEDKKETAGRTNRIIAQAATYQATDITIGFLLVLDCTPHNSTLPHITSLITVEEVTDDEGLDRVVIVARVPGNRRIPSRLAGTSTKPEPTTG